MGTRLRTGELAAAAGVSRETLRYYESVGVLPEPPRSASGYREYGREDIERLRFVGRAQKLGFTLSEIQDLLELKVESVASCEPVKKRAAAKLEEVEAKLSDLKGIASSLRRLIAQCETAQTSPGCPILSVLDGDE